MINIAIMLLAKRRAQSVKSASILLYIRIRIELFSDLLPQWTVTCSINKTMINTRQVVVISSWY